MSQSKHIISVDENDFQYEVLAYSNQAPVVVDFWAEWCTPCKVLGPVLEKLAQEARGAFRLAKLDVDENPTLAMQYGVQGIPAVKAFHRGQVVAEFTGALPEPQVRDFLRKLAPDANDLALEKAQHLLTGGNWGAAAEIFGKVLSVHPDEASALLGLAKSHLAQGQASQALAILREFPASKEYSAAEQLLPLAEALAELDLDEQEETDELAPAFKNSLRLLGKGNIEAAIDGLLDILREDKGYRAGRARKIVVGMLHLLGEDKQQTKHYRKELSSILF